MYFYFHGVQMRLIRPPAIKICVLLGQQCQESLPSSMVLTMSAESCILGMWMQPEDWPVPGKVSLPI